MENEPKEPETLEGTKGDVAQGAAGTEPKEPEGEKGTEQGAEGVQDKHGQPGINREKYQRDMKAKDDRIAELEAKLEENAKTEQGRNDLKKEIADLKAEMADERVAHKLELAGCRNLKAGKALLDDYEGSVDKLKEGEPWLFEEKPSGSTGKKPEGGKSASEEARVNKALGLKSKD